MRSEQSREDAADRAMAYALCADEEDPSHIDTYMNRAKRLRELLRFVGHDVKSLDCDLTKNHW